ncbi:MAG: RpiB/LacA/LacB family sugar-phosphate isomerase, partial [Clostridia bacterium]|nr:RpiB/LacA/LacB family sugar-phosphate isomerase [Clostridia bacterium]
GTGFGISLAASKVKGVRAVNCSDAYTARLTRQHNNANVISIGSMVVGEGLALTLVETFLSTSFEGGRHQKRLDMVDSIEP